MAISVFSHFWPQCYLGQREVEFGKSVGQILLVYISMPKIIKIHVFPTVLSAMAIFSTDHGRKDGLTIWYRALSQGQPFNLLTFLWVMQFRQCKENLQCNFAKNEGRHWLIWAMLSTYVQKIFSHMAQFIALKENDYNLKEPRNVFVKK